MGTLVCFHAHPDDEAILTGGTMRLAADAGHRVVLVLATCGELGRYGDGVVGSGETLRQRRVQEAEASAELLGVQRIEFLGYRDSGTRGEATNEDPTCFWKAAVVEASERLASILEEERADALTIYDDHGGYGHPDHVQVHRVGTQAAALAHVKEVYWATVNRDWVTSALLGVPGWRAILGDVNPASLGMPATELTHRIDVSQVLDVKRNAIEAHASQDGLGAWLLSLPPTTFAVAAGTEWFSRPGTSLDSGRYGDRILR